MNLPTQGFTLIELLIVIAIIGILAAVMIPNLIQARLAANNSAAQTLTRNAVTVAEAKRAAEPDSNHFVSATSCTPDIFSSLPSSIQSCQLYQDSNTTHVLVQSKTGKFYYFDGNMHGPIDTAPSSW